jgi:hypothetical protein
MNTTKPTDSTRVLNEVLSRNPRASLHEIRRAHPALREMSLDHLGVRVSRLLESRSWA